MQTFLVMVAELIFYELFLALWGKASFASTNLPGNVHTLVDVGLYELINLYVPIQANLAEQ